MCVRPKHAQLFIYVRGLHVANGIDVPFGPDDRPETKEPMSVNEAKFYRRRAAKLNYMALDRPGLCVAANMLSQSRVTRSSSNASVDTCENTRHVSFNTHGNLFMVPRLCAQTAIELVAGRRNAIRVAWQCPLGEDLLYFSRRFQKSVALTSGETEFRTQVAGVVGGLSLQTLFAEFGFT